MAKYLIPTLLTAISVTLLSGCVTQSFENNEPIVKNQANRDEMAATRISLGLGYLKMGDMSQAKLNLEKAKKFSPNLVQVHTAFAHYYETVGEGTLAIESFEQALSIKADSADTLNNYGVFLCRQGNVASAEIQFLKAIAVPSYLLVSESYENLASCYLQNDNFEKAEMYLNKSIYHSPNRTSTLFQMVRLQYAMGNYKEAKRYLQKFERSTQRFTANSLSLAYKLYWKLGQRRTARNYANMLVKMYPQSWEGKQYLLNELELIDADNLAKKYQLTQKEKNRQLSPSKNKRVVKLSPRKSANTPYTSSVKTVTPKMSTKNTATTEITTKAVSTSLITSTTPAAVGSGIVLLSPKVAGTLVATNKPTNEVAVTNKPTSEVAVTNKPASDITVTKVEDVVPLNKAVDKVIPLATEAVVVNQVVSNSTEPTSTMPIAATRDVPLPEALPEPVETELVVAEVIAVAEVSNEFDMVDTQEIVHTVIPGENLYSISVEYNVKLNTLRKWNNISEKNKIRIGDKLYVVDPQTVKNIND
ncbi:type IV pilus biogenesis/stability protein PilW [Colwellia demingiae]|uniref:Type IV pilus biogenesis/stability protein PilW n=1 Tax=Colwellia demingiae TaxID=89401 RepID=A0A5C6QI45_9GAMM|nr:type IV pilus biogenesis/stability protein PilW [Colwellia demingiae]TWX68725.1 type IV pilus biogenesis/stability protein PilW [Colwellia demingiae]